MVRRLCVDTLQTDQVQPSPAAKAVLPYAPVIGPLIRTYRDMYPYMWCESEVSERTQQLLRLTARGSWAAP